jgi:hypothetical protein
LFWIPIYKAIFTLSIIIVNNSIIAVKAAIPVENAMASISFPNQIQ